METSPDPSLPPVTVPLLPLADILTAVSHQTRWRIFRELIKGEPLPVMELARRLGVPSTNISKHVNYLAKISILQRGFGQLYRLPTHFLVAGEPTMLDFGAVRLRLDRLDGE